MQLIARMRINCRNILYSMTFRFNTTTPDNYRLILGTNNNIRVDYAVVSYCVVFVTVHVTHIHAYLLIYQA